MRTIKTSYGIKQITLREDFQDVLSDGLPVTGDDGDDVVMSRFLESKDCDKLLDKLVEAVGKHMDAMTED